MEKYVLGFCRGTCSEVSQGKLRLVVVSDQTKLSVLLIKYLNAEKCHFMKLKVVVWYPFLHRQR